MNLPEIELKILKLWEKKRIFEKSLTRTKKGPRFVFYEGPPTANAAPGLHHVLARAFKDAIPRHRTMKGFYCERKAGWDTHGLPVEIQVERELGMKNKKDIEKYGIDKFNKKCKETVWGYKDVWEKMTKRIAFWLDLKDPYITYENKYIETLWWIIKQIWEKGFLYLGYKVVPHCPRCETALSSHEVAQGYKKIKENTIYIKFPVRGEQETYFLVWTTTPWTLPGNTALAVGEDIRYAKIRVGEKKFILAKDRLNIIDEKYEIEDEFAGGALIGKQYEPLYPMKLDKVGYHIVSADFVNIEEGTGIVHIAPAFGEEDMALGQKEGLAIVNTVELNGFVKKGMNIPGERKFIKDADKEIIVDIKKKGLLFKEEIHEHDYPFCWRCETPLMYYARNSWFIKMSVLRESLIENNQQINWIPDYFKEGRFGGWLKEVKDWAFSRDRYWGTPLPIWQCKKCKKFKCVGSMKDLGVKIKDLHRPFIDKVFLDCECGGEMARVPDVIDVWFDSGSMPFAQWHYPFENKDKIDKADFFPADFISEAVDQTRGWFYTLLAISTLLGKGPSYKNVICLGHILDSSGQKMSKSKGNIITPDEVINKYGADALRWYLYTINEEGEGKRFNLKEIEDKYRVFFGTILNSLTFFITYTDKSFKPSRNLKLKNPLDKWIASRLNSLILSVDKKLEKYFLVSAARQIEDFISDLSNWYIRRSRRRFQKPENEKEKNEAAQTLYYVLLNLAKLAAPFIPFTTEEIYLNLKKSRMPESVHLCEYPEADKKLINKNLEQKMAKVREIVALALSERALSGIKVRQPLKELMIKNQELKGARELIDLIKDEVNIKDIVFDEALKTEVKLDKKITKELKEEGIIRELIRQIQDMRRQAGLTRKDKIFIEFAAKNKNLQALFGKWRDFIFKETISQEFGEVKTGKVDLEKEMDLEKEKIKIGIKKIK